MLFFGRKRPDIDPVIRMGKAYIRMSPQMKYLGIILDPQLKFTAHLKYVEEKMGRVNRSLGRLMPNLRGPVEWKRRLFEYSVLDCSLWGTNLE